MKIRRIEVLTNGAGTDKVSLYMEGTSPYPKMSADEPGRYPPCAVLDAQRGFGYEWAVLNFSGAEIYVIDQSTGQRSQR